MSRKKSILTVLGVLAAVAVVAGSYYLYRIHHPKIVILRSVPDSDYGDGVFHREMIGVAMSGEPQAKRVEEELDKLWHWNDEVTTELVTVYSQNSPYYIHVSGENEDGKITLRYQGCVTDAQGKTMDYQREATFDLFVRDEDFQLP